MASVDQAFESQQHPRSVRRLSVANQLSRLFTYVVLIIGAVLMFAPFAFLISSSLKTELQVFQFPIQWIPNPLRWQNYVEAMTAKPFFLFFRNTMFIVILNQSRSWGLHRCAATGSLGFAFRAGIFGLGSPWRR